MKAVPSRTTNKLHFTDLSAERFEDLCLAVIFPLNTWENLQHFGRKGTDGGVDIFASESLDEAPPRHWFVQCRRYRRASAATLRKAADDALANSPQAPAVVLVILACDVTRKAHDAYIAHATERGVETPLLWTASTLEARLYSERPDLLFAYFGVSMASESRKAEATLKRNLAMKKRIKRELLAKQVPEESAYRPSRKFEHSEVIVHSIDDTSYPNVATEGAAISGWMKLECFDLYFNGIELILRIRRVALAPDGRWALVPYDRRADVPDGYSNVRVFWLGRIPYRNIIEIDTDGDEYYPQPHLYCRYADAGEPWEGFVCRYVTEEGEYPSHLPSENEVGFEELAGRS